MYVFVVWLISRSGRPIGLLVADNRYGGEVNLDWASESSRQAPGAELWQILSKTWPRTMILWSNFVNRGIQRGTRGCGENDIIKLKSDCLVQIIIALLLQFCKAIALMSIAAPKPKRPYKFMSHPFPPRSSCVVFPPWKLGGGGGAASVNLFAGENTISVLCKLY